MVEDTDLSIADLRAKGVEEDVLSAVDMLTHRDGMSYEDYVKKIVWFGNETAIQVKLNDLHQNLWRAKMAVETFHPDTKERKAVLDEILEIAVRHDEAEKFIQKEIMPRP